MKTRATIYDKTRRLRCCVAHFTQTQMFGLLTERETHRQIHMHRHLVFVTVSFIPDIYCHSENAEKSTFLILLSFFRTRFAQQCVGVATEKRNARERERYVHTQC